MEEGGDRMNRRGVLSMLGMGAAAGPAIAKQYVGNSVIKSSPAIPSTGGQYDKDQFIDQAIPWDPVKSLKLAKEEFDILNSNRDKWIADYISREMDEYINGYGSYHYERIDADIRNMKSFSESAKMRMFIERKARRRYEQSKGSLLDRIKELMEYKA
jgi:hypothetical protein